MAALGEKGLPVPTAIAHNRHAVLMSLVDGVPLVQVRLSNFLPCACHGACCTSSSTALSLQLQLSHSCKGLQHLLHMQASA